MFLLNSFPYILGAAKTYSNVIINLLKDIWDIVVEENVFCMTNEKN